MTLTEHEIMSQHDALKKAVACLSARKSDVEAFFGGQDAGKFVFLGCGSSYLLAEGFATLFSREKGIHAAAFAAGDLLLAPGEYDEMLRDCILIAISRSGETTEMVRAISLMRERVPFKVLLLVMREGSTLEGLSDFTVAMPWAYDESVCQTRCIAVFYAVGLLLYGYRFADERLCGQVAIAAHTNEEFKLRHRPALEKVATWDFDNVVVLADGFLRGIAAEAALAFTEIAMVPGAYFHTLDYRHGPIVLNGPHTLNIMVVRPEASHYQTDMIADIKKRGGYVITFGQTPVPDSDVHISQDALDAYEVWGIPFIYLCQMIALSKALAKGLNPDKPSGLDAFIQL